jgi:ATP-dependent RNA helicase RhlE
VFNFDIPFNAEDYVHRIGRTGRAGASGLAVSLVTGSDTRLMADIEKLIKKKIEIEPFELEGARSDRGGERGERDRSERSSYRRERPTDDGDARGADLGAASPREPRDRDPRDARPVRAAPRRSQPADPFFDKPYEPDPSADPVWEDKTAAPTPAGNGSGASGLSRFIKPKRKVAALLGGSGTTRR